MLALLLSFEFTIMDSFSSLEQKYMERDVMRAEHAIHEELNRLVQIARDWGEWDATYEFVQNKDPGYITSNFALPTFQALQIAFLLIQDQNKTVIVGKGICNQEGRMIDIPPDLIATLTQKNLTSDETHTGMFEWNNTAWLFAQTPILTTGQEGPQRGILTVLSPLDSKQLQYISDNLLQNVSARILSDDENADQSLQAIKSFISGEEIVTQTVLSDIQGTPFLMLEIKSPRELYARGLLTRDYLFFSLLLLVVSFMGVAITLINLIVIAPLNELNQELAQVGKTGLLSSRIKIKRNDEIGDLSRAINQMLDQIEHAVEQRHAMEQRLSRLIALAEEGICLVGPDNRIWFANPKLASIFGKTPGELNGIHILELFEGEEIIENKLLSDQSVHHELHTRKKDGSELYVRMITAPYPLEQGEEGHICVISDITSFKENEKALLLSNKKLSLLGSMTRHDIVNQLTTIRGMLDLIHRKTNDEVIVNLVEAAEEAAERVNKHIEFSKEYQKAGMQAPIWQNLRTCWNLAYAMTKKKGLTFTYKGDELEIFADQLLQKVFYNLIDNSLKHGKNVFYITVTTRIENSNLLIIYEDDGEGIPDTMKERIFERGVGSGTGWGLFFAREVLGLTRISIAEEGAFGIGARFVIAVPHGGYREGSEPKP